jgi:hypothetical protein
MIFLYCVISLVSTVIPSLWLLKEEADNIGKVKIIHKVENNPNTPAIEIAQKFNRHLYPAL